MGTDWVCTGGETTTGTGSSPGNGSDAGSTGAGGGSSGGDGSVAAVPDSATVVGAKGPAITVTEYVIPTTSNPGAITTGPDGNIWFTHQSTAPSAIGRLAPSGMAFMLFKTSTTNTGPVAIVGGSDGNVWYTKQAGIGRMTPAGVFNEYGVPNNGDSGGLTSGPDGNLWFTEDANKIGRISPTGAVTEFALPVPNSFPMGIAAGSDGNLWFVESRCPGDCGNDVRVTGKLVIGRITPTGVITEYSTQSGNWYNGPETIGIVEGADHNMWFAEPKSNKIGRITHAGEITEFEVPSRLNDPNIDPLASTEPLGITNGPDGNVWFVEAGPNVGGRVGKLDLAATAPDPPAITITSGFTGNWFSPNQSGHGFSLEVLRDSQMLADWYVFAPNGGQSWIVAMGPISGNTAVLQAQQAVGPGGQFPPNFNPARVNAKAWGTITFTFTDCNNGQVSWQPTASGYTSGSMPITRLTMPAGLSCQ